MEGHFFLVGGGGRSIRTFFSFLGSSYVQVLDKATLLLVSNVLGSVIMHHTLYSSSFMQLTGTPSKHVLLSTTRAVL